MKFIDFFAGIGGIRLGLERAGHECVGFCEWDKFARQSYKAMHNTEGEWENHDIRTASSYGLPKADLWTFGFPCQDLSVAGKRKGLQEGERSGLFYEIIRLLQGLRQEDRPKWLLAENVKGLFSAGGGFDFLRCIVELGGLGYSVEWQLLNSKDFGVPQNRERVFIVGCLGEGSGRKVFPIRRTDGENPCASTEQRPLRLGNIYGRDKGTSFTGNVWDKTHISPTLNTAQGGNRMPLILDEYPQGLCVGGDIRVIGNYSPSGHEASRVLDPTGIAPTVMENYGTVNAVAIDLTENNPKITETARCLKARYTAGVTNFSGDNSGVLVKEATKQGYTEAFEGDSVNLAQPNSQTRRGRVGKQIANTLTCSDTMGVVVKPVLTLEREEKRQNGRRIKEDGEPMFTLTAQDRHGVAIQENVIDIYNHKMRTDGCTGTLTTNGNTSVTKCGTFGVVEGVRIRKLTARECWRLQGFPDEYFDRAKWYTKEEAAEILKKYPHTNKKAHRQFSKERRIERMSESQLYKQAGNAVTVNVAEAIGKRLREIEMAVSE